MRTRWRNVERYLGVPRSELARILEKQLRGWAECPVSQCHGRDRGAYRQFDRQLLERMAFAVDAQHGVRKRRNELAIADKIVAQMNRERCDDQLGRGQSAGLERVRQE